MTDRQPPSDEHDIKAKSPAEIFGDDGRDIDEHDRFVLHAMSHPKVYGPFFRRSLPAIVWEYADLTDLRPYAEITTNKKLARKITDKTFLLPLKDRSYPPLFLIFEHKSRVKGFNALDLERYRIEILDQLGYEYDKKRLPLVHLVVYTHDQKPYRGPKGYHDAFAAPQPLKDSLLAGNTHYDTALLDDRDMEDTELELSIVTMATKHIHDDDFLPTLMKLIPRLQKLADSSNDLDLWEAVTRYILSKAQATKEESVIDALKRSFEGTPKGDLFMTGKEYLIKLGEKRGEKRGEERGEKRGIKLGEKRGQNLAKNKTLEILKLLKQGLAPSVVAERVDESLDYVEAIAAS